MKKGRIYYKFNWVQFLNFFNIVGFVRNKFNVIKITDAFVA